MIANGSPCAWDYSSREHGSKVGRGREERGLAKPGGDGCPTLKYCNWCAQQAFFAGKKAEETSPRESTPRTLKEVGQQYPRIFSDRRSKTEQIPADLVVRRFRRISVATRGEDLQVEYPV